MAGNAKVDVIWDKCATILTAIGAAVLIALGCTIGWLISGIAISQGCQQVIAHTIKSALSKGGAGSGNYGHGGRPGKRGGSAGGGAKGTAARKFDYESGSAYLYDTESLNPRLGYDTKEMLEMYKGELYDELNRDMRRGDLWEESEEQADMIASAIDKGSLPEAITVYRGISGRVFGDGDRTGDSFTDKAFVSTTLDRDMAVEGFAAQYVEGTVLEIRVPKGTKALNMERFGSGEPEVELLLQRDSSFKIIADRRSEGKGMVLEVTP